MMSPSVLEQVAGDFFWDEQPMVEDLLSESVFHEMWDEMGHILEKNAFMNLAILVRHEVESTER